jgi:predicted ribonuclease YlaK
MTKFLVDTSSLMHNISAIEEDEIVISIYVLRELENHKSNHDRSITQSLAREALRWIKQRRDKFKENGQFLNDTVSEYKHMMNVDQEDYTDNKLVELALRHGLGIITEDISLQNIATSYEIEVKESGQKDSGDYCGVKVVDVAQDDLDYFVEMTKQTDDDENMYDLLINQYIIFRVNGKEVRAFKYTEVGGWFKHKEIMCNRVIDSRHMGMTKALNLRQACAIDGLLDDKFVVMGGKAGSGKTYLAVSKIMQDLEREKKIYIFVNNQETKGSKTYGLLKGSLNDKLLQSNIGSILSTKLGGKEVVSAWIESGKIEVLPVEHIRGVSIENATAFFTEAQNLNRDLMRTIVERVSDSSQLILDYDLRQIDTELAKGYNNGISRVIDVFKGYEFFSHVILEGNQRGEISTLGAMI